MRREASRRSAGTTSTGTPAGGTGVRAKDAIGRFALAIVAALCAALLLSASASAVELTEVGSFNSIDGTGTGDLVDKSAAISSKQAELSAKQGEVSAKQGEVAAKEAEVAAASEPEKAILEAELIVLQAQLSSLQSEEAARQSELSQLEAEGELVTDVSVLSGDLIVGQTISGNGIPASTTITAVDTGAHTLSLSHPATEAGSDVSLSATASFGEGESLGKIAVNETTGDVYAIDQAHDSVDRFSSSGVYLSRIAGSSTTSGTFQFHAETSPLDDIAVDSTNGNVYVSTRENNKLFAFDSAGNELWEVVTGTSKLSGVAVDPSGELWISDRNSLDIAQLSAADGAPTGEKITTVSETEPRGIAFDQTGRLYVVRKNAGTDRYSPTGEIEATIQSPLNNNSFDVATSMLRSDVFVALTESGQPKLKQWDSGGTVLSLTAATLTNPIGVAFDGQRSRAYLSDRAAGKVIVYDVPKRFGLSAARTGAGAGKVTGVPPGINCGGTCNAEFETGQEVTLTATANPGSKFGGWSGECDVIEANKCKVTMSAAKSVSAGFDLIPKFALNVTKVGNGSISSSPAGINCGATCAAEFEEGKVVTLSATANPGSKFSGWSGECDTVEAGKCKVTMSAAKAVTATFEAESSGGGGGGSGGGSGGGGGTVIVDPGGHGEPPVKRLICKKGFKKKTVKGKARCVKVKKHHHKRHRH